VLQKSLLLTYSDSQAWVDAIKNQVVSLLDHAMQNAGVIIAGDHRRSQMLAQRLTEYGAQVTIVREQDVESFKKLSSTQAVIVWPEGKPWFGAELAAHVSSGTYVIDAGIGSLLANGIETATSQGALLIRVNIWPTLTGLLITLQESARVQESALGWITWEGVPVVAGGAIGTDGAVIVDSVKHPTRIIGIADGRGGVLFHYSQQHLANLRIITEMINRQRLAPEMVEDV
jgi:hypothetical protein